MLNSKQRFYFDANALWKYYHPGQAEKGSLGIRRFVAQAAIPILISPLTMLEVLGVLMKYRRQKVLKQRAVNKVADRLKHDAKPETRHRHFELIPMPKGIFHQAENIVLQYAKTFDIGSNDALHLAIVTQLRKEVFPEIVLVTSDNSMQRTCEKTGLTFYNPEYP